MERFQVQEVSVSADDRVGATISRGFQDHVVLWITADRDPSRPHDRLTTWQDECGHDPDIVLGQTLLVPKEPPVEDIH